MLVFLALPMGASAQVCLNKKTIALSVGESYKLKLKKLTGYESLIEWRAEDETIADVTQEGYVTAKAYGSTDIVAVVDGIEYRCLLNVVLQKQSIRLNSTSKSLQKGKSFRLKAAVQPEGTTSAPVLWKSSNKNVAKINAKGKVTATGAGTAKITAYTADGIATKAVCKVTVTLAPLQLSETTQELTVGEKAKLSIVSGNTGDTYKWSSSDKSVVRVKKTGKVVARTEGTAVVTVTREQDGATASCTVTVAPETDSKTQTEVSSETSAETPESAAPQPPAQPSAYALQMLTILQKYSDQVALDNAAGMRWVYSNSAKSTWADARKEIRKKNVTHMNCALGCRWALREMGLLDSSNFWGEPGYVVYHGTSKDQLLAHCDILTVNKTPNELLAEGNLLPGDICTYVSIGHTNVYAGNGLWYEFGRCGLNGKYVGNEYVFDSFGPVAAVNMSGTKIGTIIRLVK